MIKSLSIVLFHLFQVDQARADQPVHCLPDNIMGTWHFHVSKEVDFVNLFKTKEVCTHNVPNKFQIINKSHQFTLANEEIWQMQLGENHVVSASKMGADSKVFKGNWTPYYDSSMIVSLENGLKFIANFRYNVKQSITKDPMNPTEEETKEFNRDFEATKTENYVTDCTQTMPGFVQDTKTHSTIRKHRIQCFYGKQIKNTSSFVSVEEKIYPGPNSPDKGLQARMVKKGSNITTSQPLEREQARVVHAAQKSSQHRTYSIDLKDILDNQDLISLVQKQNTKKNGLKQIDADGLELDEKKQESTAGRFDLDDEPSDQTDLLIETVNAMDLGWKADICKLQKHNPNYKAEECDKQKKQSLIQEETKPKFGSQENFQEALIEARKYQKKYPTADAIPDDEIPKFFDWRNVEGVDFTNPNRDQGQCGNCYSQTFLQVVEMRLNLKYGKTSPILSPSLLNSCNYLNEACEGGWSLYDANFAENGHLITEKCAKEAQGKKKSATCGTFEKCEPHSKVTKSYFIGNDYGETTEKNMMKEILRNGVVTVSFQGSNKYFESYKSGIISAKGVNHMENELNEFKPISNTSLAGYGLSWQQSNHSTVGLGWGEDPKTHMKYWIIRNSYGAEWGEHGEFRIQRGTNDFSIESMSVAYDPVLCTPETC